MDGGNVLNQGKGIVYATPGASLGNNVPSPVMVGMRCGLSHVLVDLPEHLRGDALIQNDNLS